MKRRFRFLVLLFALAIIGCSGSPYPPNIKVSREPANGLTTTDLDGAYLDSLTEWTRAAAQERLSETYERNGVPPEGRRSRAQADSRYVEREGKRLAVVELGYTGSPVRVARVVGLRKEEIVTISCTSPDGAPIGILDPESACGGAVREIFFE